MRTDPSGIGNFVWPSEQYYIPPLHTSLCTSISSYLRTLPPAPSLVWDTYVALDLRAEHEHAAMDLRRVVLQLPGIVRLPQGNFWVRPKGRACEAPQGSRITGNGSRIKLGNREHLGYPTENLPHYIVIAKGLARTHYAARLSMAGGGRIAGTTPNRAFRSVESNYHHVELAICLSNNLSVSINTVAWVAELAFHRRYF